MSEVNDKTDCKNVAQVSTTHDDYFEKLGIAAESKYKQLGVLFNIILKHLFKLHNNKTLILLFKCKNLINKSVLNMGCILLLLIPKLIVLFS